MLSCAQSFAPLPRERRRASLALTGTCVLLRDRGGQKPTRTWVLLVSRFWFHAQALGRHDASVLGFQLSCSLLDAFSSVVCTCGVCVCVCSGWCFVPEAGRNICNAAFSHPLGWNGAGFRLLGQPIDTEDTLSPLRSWGSGVAESQELGWWPPALSSI